MFDGYNYEDYQAEIEKFYINIIDRFQPLYDRDMDEWLEPYTKAPIIEYLGPLEENKEKE